ncbi:MAG: ankyrin repeat domain-containing protein [Bacteroidota bacterium]
MITFTSHFHLPSSNINHFLRRPTRWLWLFFSIISPLVATFGAIDPVSEQVENDPFLAAVKAGDENALKECLSKEGIVGNEPKLNKIYDKEKTILHIACESQQQNASCFSKLMEAIQRYFQEKYSENSERRFLYFINRTDARAQAALCIAAKKERQDIAECLILYGADLDKSVELNGDNVLHIVCKKKKENLPLFSLFLDAIKAHFKKKYDEKSYKKKYLDFIFFKPSCSYCPLVIAAQNGHLAIIKALIKERGETVHDKFMSDALLVALEKNDVKILEYFIEGCQFPIDGDERINQWCKETPLIEAIKAQSLLCVEYLLKQGKLKKKEDEAKKKARQQKADVNCSFDGMYKPLFYAANRKSFKIFKLLLDQGALIEKDYLFSAIDEKGSKDIVQFLIDNNSSAIEEENKWGRSTLHAAIYRLDNPEILALVLKEAEAHFQTKYGEDAYEEAYKAFLNKKDHCKKAAIHIAASISNLQAVQLLVNEGVELDEEAVRENPYHGGTELDGTPFDKALGCDDLEIMRLLDTEKAMFKWHILETALHEARKNSIQYIITSFKPALNKSYKSPKDTYRLLGVPLYRLISRNYGSTEKDKKEDRDRRSEIFDFLVSEGADVNLLFEGRRLIFHILKGSSKEQIQWQLESFCKHNAELAELGGGHSIFSIIASKYLCDRASEKYAFLTLVYERFIASCQNKIRDTLKEMSQRDGVVPIQLEKGVIEVLVTMCGPSFALKVLIESLQRKNEDGESPLDIAKGKSNNFTYFFFEEMIELQEKIEKEGIVAVKLEVIKNKVSIILKEKEALRKRKEDLTKLKKKISRERQMMKKTRLKKQKAMFKGVHKNLPKPKKDSKSKPHTVKHKHSPIF